MSNITAKGQLSYTEMLKSARDAALNFSATVLAALGTVVLSAIATYFTGESFAETAQAYGISGFIVLQIVTQSVVPMLNRFSNYLRVSD